MSKGAARNMQRIAIKVAAGTAPHLVGGIKQPPVLKQRADIELRRLARIRQCFELEQQIKEARLAGGNVGLLRETLEGVRSGRIEVRLDAVRRREARAPNAQTQLRKGSGHPPARQTTRTSREMAADLNDISKGKLTMTGASVIKGLLERFDRLFVDEVLQPAPGFIDKVMANVFYGLAATLEAADGLVLIDALEDRAKKIPAHNSTRLATPAKIPTVSKVRTGTISVDDITAEQYMALKALGWVMKGGFLFEPQPRQAKGNAPNTPKKKGHSEHMLASVQPLPTRELDDQPARPYPLQLQLRPEGRRQRRQQMPVPLTANARDRLHQTSAFQPVEITKRPESPLANTVSRSGFVHPPADPKINWNDSSEDGSRWDR